VNVTVERLADGPGPQIVVIDFAQFSDEKTLADTLAADPGGHRLYLADPVTATSGSRLATLADAYAEELDRQGIRPAKLVGNCSAAALALLVAERLYTAGQQPEVVLVEPTWITDDHLRADITRVRQGLGADGPVPPELTREAVLATLEADLVAKLRADGLPEEDVELCLGMLLERYVSWFGFLFETRHTPVPTPAFSFTAVVGQGSDYAGPATIVRVPAPAAETPRSPFTARALLAG
jgi:hypothetical protein